MPLYILVECVNLVITEGLEVICISFADNFEYSDVCLEESYIGYSPH
jgi:hypothetical protein